MANSDNDRPDQTLADYVGIAIGPALVMTLVGSLVLFLIEVSYSGDYVGRMRWTMCFFVFGIVLVCRIAMLPEISDRSWLYGVFLSGLTWLCLQGFVEYPQGSLTRDLSPVINLGLIAVVWWSASKLVLDCTNVDEDTDMSGEGLLQASGLESPRAEKAEPAPPAEAKTNLNWWERYQRYRGAKEKKRTLGVWIVYFSLAALPLFGLGQSLIPPSDVERRRASFWLLAVYVASGLGLLMTTCFLGLRRYLRQRRLQMPAAMTGVWLTCGVVLIAALLGAAAVIPRPSAEYSLINLQALSAPEKLASRSAMKADSPAKGEGRPGSASQNADADGKASSDKSAKGKGQGKDSGGNSSGDKGQGDGGQGQSKGKGEKGSGQDKGKGGDSGKGGKDGEAKKEDRSARGSPQDGRDPAESSSQSRQQSPSSTQSMIGRVASVLKWIVFAVVAILTLGVVLFAVIRFLANFTGWAARFMEAWSRFWARLFGPREKKPRDRAAAAEVAARAPPPRPFSSFHNPFRLGQPWTPFEFCCYTFAAFEAWTRERGVERQPGETPIEHAERVGDEIPDLETDARRLALIYGRGLYGQNELPTAVNEVLEQIWDRMESRSGQPLSV
jgi:hypothetical protein